MTEDAARDSGVIIGLLPCPKVLNDGVGAFSGEANPRGRILAIDFGEALYGECDARIGVTEFQASFSGREDPTMDDLSEGFPCQTSIFSNSLR